MKPKLLILLCSVHCVFAVDPNDPMQRKSILPTTLTNLWASFAPFSYGKQESKASNLTQSEASKALIEDEWEYVHPEDEKKAADTKQTVAVISEESSEILFPLDMDLKEIYSSDESFVVNEAVTQNPLVEDFKEIKHPLGISTNSALTHKTLEDLDEVSSQFSDDNPRIESPLSPLFHPQKIVGYNPYIYQQLPEPLPNLSKSNSILSDNSSGEFSLHGSPQEDFPVSGHDPESSDRSGNSSLKVRYSLEALYDNAEREMPEFEQNQPAMLENLVCPEPVLNAQEAQVYYQDKYDLITSDEISKKIFHWDIFNTWLNKQTRIKAKEPTRRSYLTDLKLRQKTGLIFVEKSIDCFDGINCLSVFLKVNREKSTLKSTAYPYQWIFLTQNALDTFQKKQNTWNELAINFEQSHSLILHDKQMWSLSIGSGYALSRPDYSKLGIYTVRVSSVLADRKIEAIVREANIGAILVIQRYHDEKPNFTSNIYDAIN